MTIFFDQNIGPSVARTLKARGPREFDYLSLLEVFPNARRRGSYVEDPEWLSEVGANGWLAITRDLRILSREDQRQALIDSAARVVFLRAGNAPRSAMTEFVIQRREWLRRIYEEVRPPFAFMTTLDGAPEQIDLTR